MSTETSLMSSEDSRKRVAAAAAATAARRKRRKALARNRSQSPHRPRLARSVSLISPTVTGVQEVARRWRLGHTIAIPTECTYEVGMRLPVAECEEQSLDIQRRLRGVVNGHGDADGLNPTPHVYINSLQSSSPAIVFLKNQLPERKYAFRKDGKVVSLHTFSESMEVLERIAAKVWPGPVILYIAVGGNNSTSTATSDSISSGTTEPPTSPDVHTSQSPSPPPPSLPPTLPQAAASLLATKRSSSSFLAFRCPGHPLTVKVSQEFYKNSNDLLVGLALQQKTVPGRQQRQDVDDNESDDNNHHNNNNRNSSSTYVTCANDIQSGPMAVLHGEEKLELFCVPTCEYGQPYGVTVWIEEGRRRITLRGRHQHLHHHHHTPHHYLTPHHVNHHHTPYLHHHHHIPHHHHNYQVTLSSVLRALHQVKPKTEKDRVMQAVLNKWVVDEESP